jgi:hypothetical protein
MRRAGCSGFMGWRMRRAGFRWITCLGFSGSPVWPVARVARKPFFFEKKKQKTFDYGNAPVATTENQRSKVFWFFFSKKNILSFAIPIACPASP